MKGKAGAWIEFARRDLAAAERLRDDDTLLNIVLYHCQQCIEKCLKALLEEHEIRIPRIHATVKLHSDVRKAVPAVPALASDEDLAFVDDVYLDSRYPGSLGLLPGGFPTAEESLRGLRIARSVLENVVHFFDTVPNTGRQDAAPSTRDQPSF